MSLPSIKELVKKGNMVHFVKYYDGDLWYKVEYLSPATAKHPYGWDEEFAFPVPVSDIGNATFLATDKAMLFMRYIRKHLKALEEVNA